MIDLCFVWKETIAQRAPRLQNSPILPIYATHGKTYKGAGSPKLVSTTALIVAIRTAKWVAKSSTDAQFSDLDVELDKEVSFAARISIRVMHELLRKHESLFPQRTVPIYEGGSVEDSPPSRVIPLAASPP